MNVGMCMLYVILALVTWMCSGRAIHFHMAGVFAIIIFSFYLRERHQTVMGEYDIHPLRARVRRGRHHHSER
jgi:hypothetical protein